MRTFPTSQLSQHLLQISLGNVVCPLFMFFLIVTLNPKFKLLINTKTATNFQPSEITKISKKRD